MTTAFTTIPLNKLAPFKGNVRKTQNKAFIGELAASIRAHGLQQNLVVRKKADKYEVVAGGQRLSALRQLTKEGAIKPSYPVPCRIADGELNPVEISLLENAVRDDMHPADLFEAFRALVDKGATVAEIAARFGRAESGVERLLKLARVSPLFLAAYRESKLNLDQVIAFAVSDDHDAQEHVFQNLSSYDRSPPSIRESLTADEIPASDRRVKFITLKEYESAGGGLRRDLFTEGEDGAFIMDPALLDRLVSEKLQRAAKRLSKEGWKWTEAHAEFGYERRAGFQRIHAAPAPQAAAVVALEAELDALREAWQETEDTEEEPARIAEIENEIEEIEAERGQNVWTPEQLAIAGAVVAIGHDGKTEITRGLVRPEDMPKRSRVQEGNDASEEGNRGGLSAALVEDLTAQRSAALGAALYQRPDIALAAVVHSFASRVFLNGSCEDRSLKISAAAQSLRKVEGSEAFVVLEAAREEWSRTIPDDEEALWQWCLVQQQETLLKLLAFCAASTVDAVQRKGDRTDCDRLLHADMLASAIGMDMKEWFVADAANYFSRVSRKQMLDDLREATGQPPAPARGKMKKAELAALAEREVAGTGWLPEVLRGKA